MIRGIRYQDGMDIRQLEDAGFGLVEYVFGEETGREVAQLGTSGISSRMTGLSISFAAVEDGRFAESIDRASELNASYLVFETVGAKGDEDIYQILKEYLETIRTVGIRVYIENGYNCDVCSCDNRITENVYSDASLLAETVDRLNYEAETDCFGVCLNIGYGNLLRRNLCGMIEHLGNRICLLHANDNDGKSSQCQMPYTFTRGRGELSTDWYGIIGALTMSGFKGPVVFDNTGLFEVSPVSLRPDWYRLLSSVAQEWENILELEEYLKETLKEDLSEEHSSQNGKAGNLVLFGAGRMYLNYMDVWGELYPPSFVVDNNSRLWSCMRRNICVRPPSVLLEDKKHPPVVLICNMYHVSIEKQLDSMGIKWRRYDDKYFFRYQNKQGASVC